VRECNSDAAEAIRLINEKPFMNRTLQAGSAPELNRVLVTNLQQNVDEDCIVLHLEQRKVTLVDDVEAAVEEFDETSHAAIVGFTNASGKLAFVTSGLSMIICVVVFFVFLCRSV